MIIQTTKNEELIEITKDIIVPKGEGILYLFIPHTTAALTINENADPDVKKDIISWLKKTIPKNSEYKHIEGNSEAHIKASLLGNSLNIPFKEGKLELGKWQGIYFYEGDGPREREIIIKTIKNNF